MASPACRRASPFPGFFSGSARGGHRNHRRQNPRKPLGPIGGDGLFTKEVQCAVLDGRADAAVHSLKDLPTAPVEGRRLTAVPKRGPAGDAFVFAQHASFEKLPRERELEQAA